MHLVKNLIAYLYSKMSCFNLLESETFIANYLVALKFVHRTYFAAASKLKHC